MIDNYFLESKFKYLGKDLIAVLLDQSVIKQFPIHMELVREGQYVKFIPIVLKGLIKVFT
jgi:CRP/FNR family transcriptional regulator